MGIDLTRLALAHPLKDRQAGTVAAVAPLAHYDIDALQGLLAAAEFPGVMPVRDGVDLYRITYWTTLSGRPELASALLALPQSAPSGPRGVVAWLHGTNATRSRVPSQPSVEDGLLGAALFAGTGYAFVAPDYLGLGVSQCGPPYLIARPTIDATLDLFRAVRQWRVQAQWPSSPLYIAGFSQGGHAAASVHRELERAPLEGYSLRGTAAIAGAFDLRHVSVPYAIDNKQTFYLAYLIVAYGSYYGQRSDLLLAPALATIVPDLFDGSRSTDDIVDALPREPHELLRPEVLTAMKTGADHWFTAALDDNQAHAWASEAPMHLYVGEADIDVSPHDSRRLHDRIRTLGGNVICTSLGQRDHGASGYHGVAAAKAWFDELSSTA